MERKYQLNWEEHKYNFEPGTPSAILNQDFASEVELVNTGAMKNIGYTKERNSQMNRVMTYDYYQTLMRSPNDSSFHLCSMCGERVNKAKMEDHYKKHETYINEKLEHFTKHNEKVPIIDYYAIQEWLARQQAYDDYW